MRTVSERPSFQGDVMIRRIDVLPAALAVAPIDAGKFVVAHSETGHHHVIDSRSAQMLIDETNALIAYLDVAEPKVLEHLRSFDTHEPYLLEPGFYEVRRQREHTPEGWRQAPEPQSPATMPASVGSSPASLLQVSAPLLTRWGWRQAQD